MTPEDRRHAREALVSGRLTIDQVSALREECGKTGRSFADLADSRFPGGPATAPRRANPFPILLFASALLITGLLVATLVGMISNHRTRGERAEKYMQMINETETLERQTRQQYERRLVTRRDATARKALQKARSAMAFVEERRVKAAGEPDLYIKLVEATLSFNTFLGVYPNDAAVHAERARAWDLRDNPEKTLRDLDRAVQLDPALDGKIGDRIAELRLRLSR